MVTYLCFTIKKSKLWIRAQKVLLSPWKKWALHQEASSFLAQKIRSQMLLGEIILLRMVRNASGLSPGFTAIRRDGSEQAGQRPEQPEEPWAASACAPGTGRHDRCGGSVSSSGGICPTLAFPARLRPLTASRGAAGSPRSDAGQRVSKLASLRRRCSGAPGTQHSLSLAFPNSKIHLS